MNLSFLTELPDDIEPFLAQSGLTFADRKSLLHYLGSIPGLYLQLQNASHQTEGLVKIVPLAWDKEVLGFPCYRLVVVGEAPAGAAPLVNQALSFASSEGARMVDAKVHTLDTAWLHALQEEGFRLRDTLVNLSLSLNVPIPYNYAPEWGPSPWKLRQAEPHDLDALYSLGGACFDNAKITASRILTDPMIPLEKARHFYGSWAMNLAKGEDKICLVAETGGELVGFLGLKPDENNASMSIPLNGVHPNHRGQGIYQSLLAKALTLVRTHDGQTLTITSHLTQQAIHHIWRRLGAEMTSSHYCLHFWSQNRS